MKFLYQNLMLDPSIHYSCSAINIITLVRKAFVYKTSIAWDVVSWASSMKCHYHNYVKGIFIVVHTHIAYIKWSECSLNYRKNTYDVYICVYVVYISFYMRWVECITIMWYKYIHNEKNRKRACTKTNLELLMHYYFPLIYLILQSNSGEKNQQIRLLTCETWGHKSYCYHLPFDTFSFFGGK